MVCDTGSTVSAQIPAIVKANPAAWETLQLDNGIAWRDKATGQTWVMPDGSVQHGNTSSTAVQAPAPAAAPDVVSQVESWFAPAPAPAAQYNYTPPADYGPPAPQPVDSPVQTAPSSSGGGSSFDWSVFNNLAQPQYGQVASTPASSNTALIVGGVAVAGLLLGLLWWRKNR